MEVYEFFSKLFQVFKEKIKLFLIVNFISLVLIILLVFFILPLQYTSDSTFYINKPPTSLKLLGLGGGGAKSALSLLAGDFSEETYSAIRILNSNQFKREIIKEKNLLDYWAFPDTVSLLRKWTNYISYNINDDESITISVTDTSAQFAHEMNKNILVKLDKKVIDLFNKEADAYFSFFERKYYEILDSLTSLESQLLDFQLKKDYTDPISETKVAVGFISSLKAILLESELELKKTEILLGVDNPKTLELKKYLEAIKNMLNDSESNRKNKYPTDKKSIIVNNVRYTKILRYIELNQQIMETIIPIVEEIKIKMAMNSSKIILFDPPFVPDHHSSPKRALLSIVLLLAVNFVFMFRILIYLGKPTEK